MLLAGRGCSEPAVECSTVERDLPAMVNAVNSAIDRLR